MRIYKIPVIWENHTVLHIKADNLDEAVRKAYNVVPHPLEGQHIEDSLQIDEGGLDVEYPERHFGIVPFKERYLDEHREVQVYRNLGHETPLHYSVRQGGLIIGHANKLLLVNCTFHVNEAGRQRVIQNQRKEVHAWIKGIVVKSAYGTNRYGKVLTNAFLQYDPYTTSKFLDADTGHPLEGAGGVLFNKEGISYAYGW